MIGPAVWRQALGDAGFGEVEVLGGSRSDAASTPEKGVILAQGPAEVKETAGVWVLAGDQCGVADELAAMSLRHATRPSCWRATARSQTGNHRKKIGQ